MRSLAQLWFCTAAVLTLFAVHQNPALGQLRITEVMFNPLSTNDAVWEWIEIQNLGEEVDLHGAFVDGLNDTDPPVGALPNISNTAASNTIIPAGGIAVLYDGFQSTNSPINYNDMLFRQAWGLSLSVPLIAVDFWPELPNSSNGSGNTSFGIWVDRTAYDQDVTGEPGSGVVTSFDHALASIVYGTSEPWPGNTGGVSITYTGMGDIANGANWTQSSTENGATTSTVVQMEDFINSTADAGNPGLQSPFGGSPPPGQLLITEVMFNPRSDPDNNFEWIEVLNTGDELDFGDTGYFLDDAANDNLQAPNITSGSIGSGETAVLFNENSLTVADMEAIWGDTINFIPVASWSALNTDGDTIGIWNGQAEYNADAASGEGGTQRGVTLAVASLTYSTDDQQGWPVPDGNGSIWLLDLASDPALGESWILAAENDGYGLSYNATGLGGTIDVHPGGDIGSPGTLMPGAGGTPGDYNEDGLVNAADYVLWRNHEGESFPLANERPGAVTPGVPDAEDYAFWVSQFGFSGGGNGVAVPEAATLSLAILAVMAGCVGRDRRA